MDDAAAMAGFWGAAAQVAPVLALAIVLEARYAARLPWMTPGFRLSYGLFFGLPGIACIVVLAGSLRRLIAPNEWGLDPEWAFFLLVVAALFVVLGPIFGAFFDGPGRGDKPEVSRTIEAQERID